LYDVRLSHINKDYLLTYIKSAPRLETRSIRSCGEGASELSNEREIVENCKKYIVTPFLDSNDFV